MGWGLEAGEAGVEIRLKSARNSYISHLGLVAFRQRAHKKGSM